MTAHSFLGFCLTPKVKFSFSFSFAPLMSLFTFQLQVIDYYTKKGIVANLHAEKSPKEVTTEVQKALSS